jgi:adenylate cyclase
MKIATLRTLRAALLPGVLAGVAAGALAVGRSGAPEQAELFLWDVRAARSARADPASPRVAMVAVDDATVRLAGGIYPVPRSVLAAIITEARLAGARTIAVDFVLEDPLEGSLVDENVALEEAIRGGGVVLGAAAPRAGMADPGALGAPWARRVGTFPDRDAAALAAIARPERHLRPLLLPREGKVELWLAGYASRGEAEAEPLPGVGAVEARGLTAAELSQPDPRAALVRRRHAVDAGGAARTERFAVAPPLPRFALAAAALGGVSQEQESDGRVYALRHVYPTTDGDLLSLPLAAAWLALGRPPIRLDPGKLRVGDSVAPTLPDGRVVVRWTGPHHAQEDFTAVYPTVSGADLLRAALARAGEGAPPPAGALAPLRDAVVVVSATVTAGKDKRVTPINPHAVGGEIVATAIDGFLRGRFVRRLPPLADAAASLGLAVAAVLVVGGAALSRLRPTASALASGTGVALVAAGYWWGAQALASRGIWIGAAAPLAGAFVAALGAILLTLALEMRDRRFVHDALGRYTSPVLVQRLMERPDLLDRFGGARQEISVYFSDIRGFTTLSEGMEPERLVELLNEYLSAMTGIVERHGGYVDKYVGDAIMAIWGAPLPEPAHAAQACRAAIAMRDRLAALRPTFRERYGVELHARAGLNTTAAVVGNVGSRQKTNYTALGDGVNLASRLEGANKAFGTAILCGDATRAAAGDAFAWRTVDLLRVKGKHEGVPVHELVALAADLAPARREQLSRWEAAYALARLRRFGEARDAFAALAAESPDDALAALWAERSATLAASPPPADWDGVHELHEK